MTRSLSPAVALAAVVVLSSCPPAHESGPLPKRASAAASEAADAARVHALAEILRAADRREAAEIPSALFEDANPAIRKRAALALGQIGDAASEAPLVRLAGDAAPEVRAAAAFALGLLADPGSRDALETLARDASSEVRAAAAEALGRLHNPASLPVLAALLEDVDTRVRAQADLGAWKFADPSPLLRLLMANVENRDERVRESAAYALARLTSAAVAPPSSGAPVGRLDAAGLAAARRVLRRRVADTDAEVRMQVARGLARPANPEEMAVVGVLTGDPHPGVRINALRSLAYPGMPVHPYVERAVRDLDPHVGRVAAATLGKICGSEALALLKQILPKSNSSWLREPVLTSLTQCDPREIPGVVDGLLQNPDPVMRLAAVAIVAPRPEAAARQAAELLMGDSDPAVAAAAVPVVTDQDGPIGPLVAPAVASTDPVVRAAAAEAFGRRIAAPRPGTEPRSTLLAALGVLWDKAAEDALPDARLAVLDAAAKAGRDDAVRSLLERGLKDRDVVVRRRAAARLHDVYGEDRSADVGPAVDLPLSHYEEVVRWAAKPHTAVVVLARKGFEPGVFKIALDADAAPLTAWNFAQLASRGFYDSRVVHRVVPNFVVQDGDPRGDGYGGPGYSIRDEWNPLAFTTGVVGMASDGKDTAGCQWFIVLSDQPHLDGRYTSFGRVVEGMRTVVPMILPGDKVVSIRVDGIEPAPSPTPAPTPTPSPAPSPPPSPTPAPPAGGS